MFDLNFTTSGDFVVIILLILLHTGLYSLIWIVQWSMRMFLFGNSAFMWFLPHVLCMLVVCRPKSCCMYVYKACTLISGFFHCRYRGFGQYLSCFHCLILGPSHQYTFRAWLRNILAAKILAYSVQYIFISRILYSAVSNHQDRSMRFTE
jgi:hypothetical protein